MPYIYQGTNAYNKGEIYGEAASIEDIIKKYQDHNSDRDLQNPRLAYHNVVNLQIDIYNNKGEFVGQATIQDHGRKQAVTGVNSSPNDKVVASLSYYSDTSNRSFRHDAELRHLTNALQKILDSEPHSKNHQIQITKVDQLTKRKLNPVSDDATWHLDKKSKPVALTANKQSRS